jgi:hypothetical protein
LRFPRFPRVFVNLQLLQARRIYSARFIRFRISGGNFDASMPSGMTMRPPMGGPCPGTTTAPGIGMGIGPPGGAPGPGSGIVCTTGGPEPLPSNSFIVSGLPSYSIVTT